MKFKICLSIIILLVCLLTSLYVFPAAADKITYCRVSFAYDILFDVFVDSETYNKHVCRVTLSGYVLDGNFEFQSDAEMLIPYFTANPYPDPEYQFLDKDITYDVTGQWLFLRKIDAELEARGYRYRSFNAKRAPYTLGEPLEPYEFEGETVYKMEPNRWYKYILMGDVNGDGTVDVFDIIAMRDHIFGISPIWSNGICYGDADYNGVIDIFDILAARDVIFGIA